VRRWHREGFLTPGRWFSWQWSQDGRATASITVCTHPDTVTLTYRIKTYWDDEFRDIEQAIPLSWTPCHFGSKRPWFICSACRNGRYCGRRVAKLYLGFGGIFACRHCNNLAYASQHEAPSERGILAAQRIRMRLGGDPSLAALFPQKPKWMRWRSYDRLRARAEAAESKAAYGLHEWVSRRFPRY
jgi:hypothetical protein